MTADREPSATNEASQAQVIEHLDEQIQTLLRENETLASRVSALTAERDRAQHNLTVTEHEVYTANALKNDNRRRAERAEAELATTREQCVSQIELIASLNAELDKARIDLAAFGEDIEATENRIIDAEFAATEAKAELAKAREAVIEECAKMVDNRVQKHREPQITSTAFAIQAVREQEAQEIAFTIRALKAPQAAGDTK